METDPRFYPGLVFPDCHRFEPYLGYTGSLLYILSSLPRGPKLSYSLITPKRSMIRDTWFSTRTRVPRRVGSLFLTELFYPLRKDRTRRGRPSESLRTPPLLDPYQRDGLCDPNPERLTPSFSVNGPWSPVKVPSQRPTLGHPVTTTSLVRNNSTFDSSLS